MRDIWLSGAHDNDDRDYFLEEEVPSILNEVKPESLSAFCEAVGEDCLFKRKEQIETALYSRDFAELGRLVWACNLEYWESYAENLAADRWESGYRD